MNAGSQKKNYVRPIFIFQLIYIALHYDNVQHNSFNQGPYDALSCWHKMYR